MGGLFSMLGLSSSKPLESAVERRRSIHTLTDTQLDEFQEAFRSFDRDGSGSIDTAELRTLLNTVGQHPTDAELDKMIKSP